MLKFLVLMIFSFSLSAFASEKCDVRPGQSVGVQVLEFVSLNKIHSKIPLHEVSSFALSEEVTNLQDMGLCEDQFSQKKCVLKFEKQRGKTVVTFVRGLARWKSWDLALKEKAMEFAKSFKRLGFCS
jgi:hypothetical protein